MTFLAADASLPPTVPDEEPAEAVVGLLRSPEYPCVGARSVLSTDRATIRGYDRMACADSTAALLGDLLEFAKAIPTRGFASFIAVFRAPLPTAERQFEQLLWSQLRLLHEADEVPWSDGVSPDPSDTHFGFSVGGTAFFVVGMHPAASRSARRMPYPTLVFNPHEQFETLRRRGQFTAMRDRIRRRDEHLQGSRNPMVSDHGDESEARQYSGRLVEPDWRAPFAVDQPFDGSPPGGRVRDDNRS